MRLSPIILALDVDGKGRALYLVEELSFGVDVFKIGPVLFLKYGPKIVEDIVGLGKKVFLDLKFHDIPNTVASAVKSAKDIGVFMLTVHLSGGRRMLEDAVKAKEKASEPLILGVSVLTSMQNEDLQELGISSNVNEQVVRLVNLGIKAGVDGFVCSAHELNKVRQIAVGKTIVVPGVRPLGAERQDQRRVASPEEAIAAGADFVVMGRPIYEAQDPAKVLEGVLTKIRSRMEEA
ncbi:orotidine-5'-phosphate decarboxylase [Thermosulfidibacter takaii ABI70S6]|uniref:Orotidine 5'-phosphate decarboxylase n=2 Tax=Thermosulfidibacter takaii TaxID=412593 RepID=A0A0S3QW33_THET7|nr:orotidine-5'-phosphate decarboxylase [Thermosulfidibacter takaii ABI70S6]